MKWEKISDVRIDKTGKLTLVQTTVVKMAAIYEFHVLVRLIVKYAYNAMPIEKKGPYIGRVFLWGLYMLICTSFVENKNVCF